MTRGPAGKMPVVVVMVGVAAMVLAVRMAGVRHALSLGACGRACPAWRRATPPPAGNQAVEDASLSDIF